jgi:hypothetical protein
VDGILFALLGSREIEIAAQKVRDGQVRLKNSSQHFLVELLLKSLGRLEKGIGIRIFRREMAKNFWVFLLTEPRVVVDSEIAVKEVLDRLAAGLGWQEILVLGGVRDETWSYHAGVRFHAL